MAEEVLVVSELSGGEEAGAVAAGGGRPVQVSPGEAEAALRVRRPALVLLDGTATGIEDGSLIARVRATPNGKDAPLVLLASPGSSPELIEASWKAGLDDCVVRPLLPGQVQARMDAVRGRNPEARTATLRARKAPGRVLVLGDDGPFQRQLTVVLQHVGCHVSDPLPASNGSESHSGGEPPDLVLLVTDILTPLGMEHVARTLKAARRTDPTGALPLLVISRRGAPQDAFGAGSGIHVLDRAVPVEAIVKRVNEILGRPQEYLRAHERVSFFCPVEFREAGGLAAGPWSSGFSFDVTSGGIFIKSLVPLRAGAAVELKIRLTTTREELPVTGVVAWANHYFPRRVRTYPVGMGVQFLGAVSRKLAQLIELCRAGSDGG